MKANLIWTSVDEDHIRAHPYYASLPPEKCVIVTNFESLSQFRQSSVQWALMHNGRLTTSKAASVLGIYEPQAAKYLHIPRSLTGSQKAQRAYNHLCGDTAFSTIQSAKAVLMEKETISRQQYDKTLEIEGRKIWKPWRNPSNWRVNCWTHNYNSWYENAEEDDFYGLRMAWGSIHEPTAILVAINYFSFYGSCVAECGMFPGEALFQANLPQKQMSLLQKLYEIGCPIGASPDGLIHHSDGSVEVLEVKNHCPFRRDKQGKLYVFDQFPSEEILLWVIPQIQLEMFCVGPHCQSAILVRLTATKGAVICRVYRDDTFIESMLNRFVLFYEKFVQTQTPPPRDFGFGDMQSLLDSVVAIAQNATLVERIQHRQVQRKRSEGKVPLLM